MNEHVRKDAAMAMTTEEAVAKGAKLFADAETDLTKLAVELPKVFTAIRDGGHIGGIECMQLIADATGKVSYALSTIATLHADLTKKAQEKGIDLPVIASGGR